MKTNVLNWKVSPKESELITDITSRAVEMGYMLGHKLRSMDVNMDVTACHANGCPLNLAALLKADDFNFAHDVFGIRRHLDRSTGKLTDCFLPRFAA